jgi:tetratricopeptide (TPR) repeat protein
MQPRPRFLLLIACAALAACQGPAPQSDAPQLFEGYGGYHRTVSAADNASQPWIDQGFQLLYGFNHDEGVRSFQHATTLSPDCAMAWWGIAYGYGIDVNNPQVSDEEARMGFEAAQHAVALAASATPIEQALIHAVAQRAVYPLPEDRRPLDEAYAAAMREAWQAFPNDPDVGALYAEALMNLQPWAYWSVDGEPLDDALEIVATLERVMQLNPVHPGANHFYIHAVEASPDPDRATIAADRLRNLVPGSGHLVHMPSHIYINTGRYADAAIANEAAIAADESYFAKVGPPGFYSLYYIHNIHFLAFASMMEGRSQVAIDATRHMESQVPPEFLENFLMYGDGLMPAKFHALIRFGRWEEVLGEPEYPEFRKVSRAVRSYARVVALANLLRIEEARAELARFHELSAEVTDEWMMGANKAPTVLSISALMAEAELLWREGNQTAAFAKMREAVAEEDQLVYDEPPGWMLPVRHALGAILLAGGEAAQAEQVYLEDLADWRENAWSLLGLEQALRAQGKTAEADALTPRVTAAWARADVAPTASCYCGVTHVESEG